MNIEMYKISNLTRRGRLYLYNCFFSIFVFVSICIIHGFFTSIPNKINNYEEINNLFILCGSVLATMMALIVSLSIIPIQRAIEIFSPTVRRNYIKDIFIQSILIIMGLFIFVSLLLPWISIQNNWKAYFQIEILAISLDLIRWHFRRISFLLEPYNAVNILSKEACSLITKTQRMIAINSFKKLKKISRAKWSMEVLHGIELQYYKYYKNIYDLLFSNYINELEDIALKAISRSEKLTAKYAIDGISKIVCVFLDSRKENYQLYPIEPFVFGSDLDNAINPVYERLLNICRIAIHKKDEQSGIQVVQALSYIANKTAELRGVHEHSAPLAGMPISYLAKCSELSYNSDLDEISWNVVNELCDISRKAPDNLLLIDLHSHILSNLSRISQKYFLLKKDIIGKQAVLNMCCIAYHLIEHNHYASKYFLAELLRELETNIPFMRLNEKEWDTNSFPPYSMASNFSIGYIVSIAASHIKPNIDAPWANPYHDFIELNKEIYMHFRRIAENKLYDIQNSFLLWTITNTIESIAKVYLHVASQKITDNSKHIKELINQVNWYQSFFWAVFNKKEIDPHKAEAVSDAMATIGLPFANAGFNEVPVDSIEHICYVAKIYIGKTERPEVFSVADILECAWHIRCFAEHKNNSLLAQIADVKIKEVIDMALEKQVNVQEAFDLRKQQLKSYLRDYEAMLIPTSSRDYLKLLMQNNPKPKGDGLSPSKPE